MPLFHRIVPQRHKCHILVEQKCKIETKFVTKYDLNQKCFFLLVKSQQKCPWDMSAVESAVKTFLSGQQFVKHGGLEVVECFSLLSALS